MASVPFQVEDQTDEDFFDKLVEDDFGITKPSGGLADSVESNESKAFADLSIADENTVSEGFGNGRLNSDGEDPFGSVIVPALEVLAKDILVSEESVSLVSANLFSFDTVIESEDSVPTRDIGSDSVTKSNGSQVTNVKEVQWSSFTADLTGQKNTGGFGSYSDFFTELSDSSPDPFKEAGDKLENGSQPTTSLVGNSVTDSTTSFSSIYEHQDGHASRAVNGQTTDGQNLDSFQCWESLYPGWRYDTVTGEWHQLEGYDASADTQVGFQDKDQSAADNIVSNQRLEVSYLQQTPQSVMGTMAQGYTATSASNWNQLSQGSQEYPAHMVFDPQYPGWFYDTISQEWRLLESYAQAVQPSSSTANEQQTQYGLASSASDNDHSLYNEHVQFEQNSSQRKVSQDQSGYWTGSTSTYSQSNMWQSKEVPQGGAVASFTGSQQNENLDGSPRSLNNYSLQLGLNTLEADSQYKQPIHGYKRDNGAIGFDSFTSTVNLYNFHQQPKAEQWQQKHMPPDNYDYQKPLGYSPLPFQTGNASSARFSSASKEGRSSAGRPPHALVTFGFGGKLAVLKDSSASFGSQDPIGGSISILNLAEVVKGKVDPATIGSGAASYFYALCQQSFPGPLVGGNAATKEVTKWIDERISNCQSPDVDLKKGELLRLLLSLLKISCQHYGKIRSPFGVDSALQENDGPESDVAKLFASAGRNGVNLSEYSTFSHCMQNLPTEGQIRRTAFEVQNLLVSGRRKEALQCAQEGQLWGPALVLAAQLGDKFYVDTVKQMAQRQFMSGSPLRTLCLLIAGQPADVFSTDSSIYQSPSGAVNMSQQHTQFLSNGMLDEWEANLAIITTNRTKDDELVIIHLGDCLWKERGEVAAAHICYLVAETNFESYSDSARMCLIGGDHWRFPRTYASPDAIQRTEVYEYSKVLGNAQFVLLPFQPYKLIYAHMLAEVGKVSESLRYCQAILKILKSSGRAPEVEPWKLLTLSLEERIRTHQQGGYSSIAPTKLVGKLFTSIDKSIHRMIGTTPPPAMLQQNDVQGNEHNAQSVAPKVASSQSAMALSSMMTSAEPMSEWAADCNRMMPNRSISEPTFGRNPKQDPVSPSQDASYTDAQGKASSAVPSRLGRFGSQLFQKTIGWVARSRSDRQAKLGEKNKFYYDEKLKRWVEEGAEPLAEEVALPPPPTTASFQNGASDYNINGGFKIQNLPVNGGTESKSPNPQERGSGIPPIPPSTNQFSARGRLGVRSRYVDTFNKGGGTPTNQFQSLSTPVVKPVGGAKFFVPTPAVSFEHTGDSTEESTQEIGSTEEPSTSVTKDSSSSLSSLSSSSLQQFSSVHNTIPLGNKGMDVLQSGSEPLSSQPQASSWYGSYGDPLNFKATKIRSQHEELGVQFSSFMSTDPSSLGSNGASPPGRSTSFGDDLHEVEL